MESLHMSLLLGQEAEKWYRIASAVLCSVQLLQSIVSAEACRHNCCNSLLFNGLVQFLRMSQGWRRCKRLCGRPAGHQKSCSSQTAAQCSMLHATCSSADRVCVWASMTVYLHGSSLTLPLGGLTTLASWSIGVRASAAGQPYADT